jgi:hypothetical protein
LRVAIIDDAFDALTYDTLDPIYISNFLEEVKASERADEWEAASWSIDEPEEMTAELFDLLHDPDGEAKDFVKTFGKYVEAAESERKNVGAIAEMLDDLGYAVTTFGVDSVTSDKLQPGTIDIAFLDYFLGPQAGDVGAANSAKVARTLIGKLGEKSGERPFIVLMSSRLNEADNRALRLEWFKTQTKNEVPGSAFLFAPKSDLSERWQVALYCDIAKQTVSIRSSLEGLLMKLRSSMEQAMTAVVNATNELELADWSYLHRLKLSDDGHPLGDYLAWLIGARFSYELFETTLRPEVVRLNKSRFDDIVPSPSAPSKRVADMYESGVFERGLGPIGPHPLASSEDEKKIPFLLLGDIFHSTDRSKVIMVASADCDLSMAPGARNIPPTRSVLLIPGVLKPIGGSSTGEDGRWTDLFRIGTDDYAIDWRFGDWSSRAVGELEKWLKDNGFDTTGYARFRPSFGLSLQQSFHAWRSRIGLPKEPPLFRSPRVRLAWREAKKLVDLSTDLDGVSVVRALPPKEEDEAEVVRISVAAANRLRQILQSQAEEERKSEVPIQRENFLQRIEAATKPDMDTKWASLVKGQFSLPAPGAMGIDIAGLPIRLARTYDVSKPGDKGGYVLLNIEL